ncbi:unnamed protein product [Prorocentrum cordatum]|uniref:Cyclic nucleotide-binding domain-containing protein n=1 Tax=Prorocentrum cordatum TaxID=2364126 RepID=A0ABN9UNT5_9DINO|nr:unnamed protein product [Polarella glacialis]
MTVRMSVIILEEPRGPLPWSFATRAFAHVVSQGDTRLKILVKGSASISIEGGPSVAMPPFSSIGETLFLRGRRLWTREVVVATERVLCVSWDPDRLREWLGHNRELDAHANNVLSELMCSNLSAVSQLRSRLEVDGGHESEACNIDTAGPDDRGECARRAPEPSPAQSAGAARQVGGAELGLWISYLQVRTRLGEAGSEASGRERACLLAYLGVVGLDTKLDRGDVEGRLRELDASLTALERAGLTLEEFASILGRSATTIDTNGDGVIGSLQRSWLQRFTRSATTSRRAA